MAGLLAALVPEQWTRRIRLWWLWVIPVLAMIACIYLTLPWFRLQVGLGQGPSIPRLRPEVTARTGKQYSSDPFPKMNRFLRL